MSCANFYTSLRISCKFKVLLLVGSWTVLREYRGSRLHRDRNGEDTSAAIMSNYSFPMLKKAHLVANLHELGLDLAVEDLSNPKPETVRHVYETMIEHCMSVTPEELSTPKFAATEALQHAELHEDSVPVVEFIRHLYVVSNVRKLFSLLTILLCRRTKLLDTCGVSEPCLPDLSKPDGKRFCRNLSAIINFAKFREERVAIYTDLSEETDVLIQDKAKVQKKFEAEERKLQKIVCVRTLLCNGSLELWN